MTTHYGPEPAEAILSAVCESFACPPSVARREDWTEVLAVLEYRSLRLAIDTVNRGDDGARTMEINPSLMRLLTEMHRAQRDDVGGVA